VISDQHQRFLRLLDTAQNFLPSSTEKQIPLPGHLDHPDLAAHNNSVFETLRAEQKKGSELLRQCEDSLAWLGKLVNSTERLENAHENVNRLEGVLREHLTAIQGPMDQSSGSQRPFIDSADIFTIDFSGWIAGVPELIASGERDIKNSTDAIQKLTLAIMQHRQMMRGIPRALSDGRSSLDDSVMANVEQHADDLLVLSQLLSQTYNEAALEVQIAPLAFGMNSAVIDIGLVQAELKAKIDREIDEDLTYDDTNVQKYSSEMTDLDKRVEVEAPEANATLTTLIKDYPRPTPAFMSHLLRLVSVGSEQQADLRRILGLYARIAEQARVVKAVETEAVDLLRRIGVLQNVIEELKLSDHDVDSDTLCELDLLDRQVHSWEGDLSGRVVYVSSRPGLAHSQSVESSSALEETAFSHGSSSVRLVDGKVKQLRAANVAASEPPLTPPISPPISPVELSAYTLKSIQRDAAARSTINDCSARVSSALHHLRLSFDDLSYKRWVSKRNTLTKVLEGEISGSQSLREHVRGLLDQVQEALAETETVEACELIIIKIEALARRAEDEDTSEQLNSAVNALESFLRQDMPSSNREDHGPEERSLRALSDAKAKYHQLRVDLAALLGRAQTRKQELERSQSAQTASDDFQKAITAVSPPSISTALIEDGSGNVGAIERPQFIDIQQQLYSLHRRVQTLAYPSESDVQVTPRLRILPTPSDVLVLRQRGSEINIAIDALDLAAEPSVIELRNIQAEVSDLLAHLDILATFARTVKVADKGMSRLLDTFDTHDSPALHSSGVSSSEISVASVIDEMETAAQAAQDDFRVDSEVQRVLSTWKELQGMIAGSRSITPLPEDIPHNNISEAANTTTPSTFVSRLPQSISRNSVRSVTSPFYNPSLSDSIRSRAVSDTPARIRMESLRAGSGIPRMRKESLTLGSSLAGSMSSVSAMPSSSAPRVARNSTPVQSIPRTTGSSTPIQKTPRARRISRLPVVPVPKMAYVADPKNRLDVAVGRIVNKLNVSLL
jgi:hypothetical protein